MHQIHLGVFLIAVSFLSCGSGSNFSIPDPGPAGELDLTWGGDGLVQFDIENREQFANSIAVLSDGKVMVVGDHESNDTDIVIMRFKTDGSIDANFGDGNGYSIINSGFGNDSGKDVFVNGENSAFVVTHYSGPGPGFIGVLKYNADGVLNDEFGNNGLSSISGFGFPVTAVRGRYDFSGNLVLVGNSFNNNDACNNNFFIVRITAATGQLDTSFSNDGKLALSTGSCELANSIEITRAEQIIVTGISKNLANDFNITAIRINRDGTQDSTYSAIGLALGNTEGRNDDTPSDTVLLKDESLLTFGGMQVDGTETVKTLIYKFTSDGEVDTQFDSNGWKNLTLLEDNTYEKIISATLLPDDNIMLAISRGPETCRQLTLALIDSQGALDTNFGQGGIQNYNVAKCFEPFKMIYHDSDKRLYIAGRSIAADAAEQGNIGVIRIWSGMTRSQHF